MPLCGVISGAGGKLSLLLSLYRDTGAFLFSELDLINMLILLILARKFAIDMKPAYITDSTLRITLGCYLRPTRAFFVFKFLDS